MRRMIRLLPLILGIVAPGLCGCVAHTYSSVPIEPLSEVAQERQRFASNDLPTPPVARGQAPDRIEPIDTVPETLPASVAQPSASLPVPSAQPVKRSFRERVASLFSRNSNATTVGVLPDGTITMNGNPVPTIHAAPTTPPLPVATAPQMLPPAMTRILPPTQLVPPPTPEQLNAVPAQLVEMFKTGNFDPNVVPASGVTEVKAPKTKAPIGTWYREVGQSGVMMVMKITPETITMTTVNCLDLETGPTTITVSMVGEYSVTKDGTTIYGYILGTDCGIEGNRGKLSDVTVTGSTLTELRKTEDQPFSFNFVVIDGELFVRKLRGVGKSEPNDADPTMGKYQLAGPNGPPKRTSIKIKPPTDTPKEAAQPTQSSLNLGLELVSTLLGGNAQKGAVIGSAIGSGVGSLIGDATGEPKKGAAIGAMLGASLGAKLAVPPQPVTVKESPKPTPSLSARLQGITHWLGFPPTVKGMSQPDAQD